VFDSLEEIIRAKDAIYQANSLAPSYNELGVLGDIEFFPVKTPNGIVNIEKPTATFYCGSG
jgi:hypothetical protein